jgi:hypothetical protein
MRPLFGQIECRHCQVGHAFECDQVSLFEGISVVGKQFKQSPHLAATRQKRQDHNRGDTEIAAGFQIHARIGLGIVAAQ